MNSGLQSNYIHTVISLDLLQMPHLLLTQIKVNVHHVLTIFCRQAVEKGFDVSDISGCTLEMLVPVARALFLFPPLLLLSTLLSGTP
jgi:hypothetical protein